MYLNDKAPKLSFGNSDMSGKQNGGGGGFF